MNKIIVCLMLLGIMSCNTYSQDYNGKWVFKNQYIDIELELSQTGNKITGTHCIIYGAEGNYIDCADENQITINGDLINNGFIINLDSEYVDGASKISLKLLADGRLEWNLLSYPKDIFFYPDKTFLKKEL